MENIQFDRGIKAYQIQDGGILRFNPSDPNVYGRFLEAADKIADLEEELVSQASHTQNEQDAAVRLMLQADEKIKQILNWVFGHGNDFDQILGGVNLMAIADNGEQVVTNLLAALEPILVEGAQRYTQERTAEAVKKANDRREGL